MLSDRVRNSPGESARVVSLLCLERLGNSQLAKERSKKREEEKRREETGERVKEKGREVPGHERGLLR